MTKTMNKYHVEISTKLQREFKKLKKKNLTLLIAINKKVEEIRLDPESYKNLNAPMNNLKRVHIGSFVLLFSVDVCKFLCRNTLLILYQSQRTTPEKKAEVI